MRLVGAFLVVISSLLALPALGDGPQDDIRSVMESIERKDFKEALRLVRPLAEAGHPHAQWILGSMYKNGAGVPHDMKTAIRWWIQAAEKGFADAQLSLGDSYVSGQGVAEDWNEAVKWWRKAAAQNISRAQTGLGLALYWGRGSAQDKVEAAQWFLKAADAGQTQSQAMLARMYCFGEGGLKRSSVEAYKWLLIAGEEGKELTLMTRPAIEMTLGATDKKEAIRLADKWKFEKGKIKTPPPPPLRDEDIPTFFFLNANQLASRCSSVDVANLAWCDAYIAGVIDTLGGRRNLDNDAKNVRLCFSEKKITRQLARDAVNEVLSMTLEDKSSPVANGPAVGNVVAGILVNFCK